MMIIYLEGNLNYLPRLSGDAPNATLRFWELNLGRSMIFCIVGDMVEANEGHYRIFFFCNCIEISGILDPTRSIIGARPNPLLEPDPIWSEIGMKQIRVQIFFLWSGYEYRSIRPIPDPSPPLHGRSVH